MRTLLVALLLMTVAFAGCSDGGGGKDDAGDDALPSKSTPTGPSGATGSASASQTTAPQPPANRAPVAALASNATSGAAPLRVSFTLGGSDPDGNALAYKLSFGDGSDDATGTLPATVEHTFAAGNSTVKLTVSDGKLADDATVTISAAAAASAEMPPPVVFTGTATATCQLFDQDFNDVCLPPDSKIHHPFSMPVGVKQIVATLTWELPVPTASDLDLYIYDAGGEEVGASACSNSDPLPNPEMPVLGTPFSCPRGNSEEATVTGISLAGAEIWTATIDPYQAPAVDYTLTITYS